jgi:hypothetical protein
MMFPFFLCVKQIVESVNDLAQIMKDLSVLVIDQVVRLNFFFIYSFFISRNQPSISCNLFVCSNAREQSLIV